MVSLLFFTYNLPDMNNSLDTICGIDEAGRGPLAGPVTAAAVILPVDYPIEELKDSKKLSPGKRELLSASLMNHALDYALGWVWPHEIDRINIHRASLLAMKRAFLGLKRPVELVLVDGKFEPDVDRPCRAIIKGDDSIPSIQAASILAKTARDRWMIRYSWIEKDYGYERHKGYPTREHARICREIGPSAIQRMTFRIPYPDLSPDPYRG